jgi:hypothetical protein
MQSPHLPPARDASPTVQVLRGLRWAALVAVTVVALAWSAGFVGSTNYVRRWNPLPLLVVCAGAGVAVLGSRLRSWGRRPRWFPIGATTVLAVAAIPVVWPFAITNDVATQTCLPILDAWRPIVAKPSERDMHVWQSAWAVPPRSVLSDAAKRRAHAVARDRVIASPAYRRAMDYAAWRLGRGVCAPRARRHAGASLAALAAGVLTLGAGSTVRRRRLKSSGIE